MNLPKSLTTVTTLSKILALILFISLPILGFWFGMEYQKKTEPVTSPVDISSEPASTPIPTVDETETWKTYRNEDIGFEIKNFGDSNLIELASRVWISKLGKNQSLQKYPDFISLTDGFVISIEKHENKGVLLETILNNEAQAYKTEKGSGSGKLLSGPNNHTFIEKSAYIMKIFQVVEITQVFIPKDNENYILITYAIEDPNNNSYETTLNQILSTFGFLGTPDEIGWKNTTNVHRPEETISKLVMMKSV